MKFRPDNHIPGKVYDLTQENMNTLIGLFEFQESRIRKLEEALVYYYRMSAVCGHDDPTHCFYCPDAGKRARKDLEEANADFPQEEK